MRNGDTGAYDELYRRHAPSVRRYARTCCRDADTAEDLTNEVFARTLQAVRGGRGPTTSVRAYLLTSVRHVAAAWARTQKREQLVEDFAVFAQTAAGAAATGAAPGAVGGDETLRLGADVRAMQEAEQTLVVRAFKSLSEKDQMLLWHTTVEEAKPRDVAPLLGLSDNATAVAAHRARENLRKAYLQAHVSQSLTAGGDCARYADRLGAYARGGLRMRAELGLRKHLGQCARCEAAAAEVMNLNERIGLVLPVALIGWFATAGGAKVFGVLLGGAGAGAAAGSAAAAGGAATGGGAAGGGSGGAGGTASEGLGATAKAGIGAAAATAAAAGIAVAVTLAGSSAPQKHPVAEPPPAASKTPSKAPEKPAPVPKPPASPPKPEPESPAPKPSPKRPAPTHSSAPAPAPRPTPTSPAPQPTHTPRPTPEPPQPARVYQLNVLKWDVFDWQGERNSPTVRTGESGWLWQRHGMSTGGTRFAHGVTTHPASSVTIDLNRACRAYDAFAGVDDLTREAGGVRFAVYTDGTLRWTSPVVRGGQPPVPVHVPLAGARSMRLLVTPRTPLGTASLADWARSRISCR